MSTAALEAWDHNLPGYNQSLNKHWLCSSLVDTTDPDPSKVAMLCPVRGGGGLLLLACSVLQFCAMLVQSFFSWHVEDVDLLSINYLHYGASKVQHFLEPCVPLFDGSSEYSCLKPTTAVVQC